MTIKTHKLESREVIHEEISPRKGVQSVCLQATNKLGRALGTWRGWMENFAMCFLTVEFALLVTSVAQGVFYKKIGANQGTINESKNGEQVVDWHRRNH